MHPSRQGIRLVVAALLTLVAVASVTLMRETPFYPNIVILAPGELRASFLHQGRMEKFQCEADVQKLVVAINSNCPTCRILEQRCIDRLEPRQRRMLYETPLDLPTAHFADGIVSFGSQDPLVALAACKESERQASVGPNGSIFECHSPGTALPIRALSEIGRVHNLGVYALTSFCLTIAFVLLLTSPAVKFGLVDTPTERKQHLGDIPLIGGLAMCFAFTITSIAVAKDAPLPLFLAIILLGITGLLDDLKELSAGAKLFMQILAAVLMISWAGIEVRQLGDLTGAGLISLGRWTIPLTVFGVVGVINATNMIDGLDGLAGGIALTASLWLMFIAYTCGAGTQTALLAILSAGIAGFLIFNLSHPWHGRASVFMGDTGSIFLGFILAWFAVDLSQMPAKHVYPITVVWILGLPLLDTVSLMLRRVRKGGSPFAADRQHVHHILLAANMSKAKVVVILVTISALFGAVGVAGWYFSVPEYWLFYGYLALFATYYLVTHHAWRVMKLIKHM